MRFELQELPYEMDALEPYISRKTLEYHYGKYYTAYLSNLNNLIKGTRFSNLDLETIIKVADGPVFNNASQLWNHTFYFECLQPFKNSAPESPFTFVIKRDFGSVAFFRDAFFKAVDSLCGVGWIWLVLNPIGSIEIMTKNNAGNPLRIGYIPLMNCDVWEHAYYLDYQDRCCDYINAFWNLINWSVIEKRYNNAINGQDNTYYDQKHSY